MEMNDETNTLTNFFSALAERAYKENDLSDVTYAVCRSDMAFMKFFLDFFFKGKIRPEDVKIFEREHSEGKDRPDFWIETKHGDVYIIEVKIWDWNQHFEQYHNLLKKHLTNSDLVWDHLGYIANYKVMTTEKGKSIDEHCSVHTWQDFKLAIDASGFPKSHLVLAYVQYLKALCHLKEVKIPGKWKISGRDFRCFRELVTQFYGSIGKVKNCSVYSRSKRNYVSQWCFGEFFELKDFRAKGNSVWGWFGAYYVENGINICVEFEDRQGWGKPVCDKFRHDEKMEDGSLRFWFGKNASQSTNIEVFFKKVISLIRDAETLNDKLGVDIECEEDNAKSFNGEALAMKFLPYVLETQLLSSDFCAKLASKGYSIGLSEAEDQWGYCGKDFILNPINFGNQNELGVRQRGIEGWLGVVFKNGWGENKNAKGQSLKEFPTFVVEIDANYLGEKIKQRSDGVTWYKDDYGYGCHDIYIEDEGMEFNEVLDQARTMILDVL